MMSATTKDSSTPRNHPSLDRQDLLRIVALTLWLASLGPAGLYGQDTDSPTGLSGFSESQAYEVDDRLPLSQSNEFLVRLLYRASRTPRVSFERFTQLAGPLKFEQLRESPRKFRFWVQQISGSLSEVKRIDLGARATEELPCYYQGKLMTAEGPCVLIMTSIPRAWKNARPATNLLIATGSFSK